MDKLSFAEYLATFLPMIVAVLNPAAASLLSRQHFPSIVTAGITVALSAVEAFAAQLFQGGDYSFSWATLTALGTYVLSALARSQFWKDTSADAKLLAFPQKLPPGGKQPGAEPDELVNADVELEDGVHAA